LVLHKGKTGAIYNIGGHNERQNIQIVKLIIETLRRLLKENPEYMSACSAVSETSPDVDDWMNENLITYVTDRLGHDQRYAIDPEKITNELGWYPETRFEDGIVKTIRWYLENQDWVNDVTSGDYQKYYEKMYGAG
jgi:dTDP-glucose 4,6-dehydratase